MAEPRGEDTPGRRSTVTVLYDVDGTTVTTTMCGHHARFQVWPGGRGQVHIFDAQDRPVRRFAAACVYMVDEAVDHG